jgi:integrase
MVNRGPWNSLKRRQGIARFTALRRGHRNTGAHPREQISDAPETLVFALPAQQTIDKTIKRCAKRAGFDKRISFLCGRPTFATLALTHGVDLYTMSKLLGHRDVSATQIYARIIDEKKRAAVELFRD